KHLVFDKNTDENVISYTLRDHANGDVWKEIKVIFNGNPKSMEVKVPKGNWTVIADDGKIKADGLGATKGGKMTVAPTSALILAR
ncbi:MAG: alpha amylase C-terminal domain-containing protein, partial [Muribaculaceae bacterium]|nr:alpha amylase C-terminal domain-containing protein [Muribaculaceae bacterium]